MSQFFKQDYNVNHSVQYFRVLHKTSYMSKMKKYNFCLRAERFRHLGRQWIARSIYIYIPSSVLLWRSLGGEEGDLLTRCIFINTRNPDLFLGRLILLHSTNVYRKENESFAEVCRTGYIYSGPLGPITLDTRFRRFILRSVTRKQWME